MKTLLFEMKNVRFVRLVSGSV